MSPALGRQTCLPKREPVARHSAASDSAGTPHLVSVARKQPVRESEPPVEVGHVLLV